MICSRGRLRRSRRPRSSRCRPRCGCGRRTASGTCGRRPACALLDLSRRQSIMSAPACLEGARDLDRVVRRDAAFDPVVRRDAHRHRLVVRPDRAHRAEHLQRKAQPVFERAAVFVGALVGERRDERRQQIAVRAVQLEPVETGLLGHARRRARSRRARASMSARVIARGILIARAPRRRRRARSAASCRRRAAGRCLPTPSCVEPFGAGMAELHADLRVGWRARNRRCASSAASVLGVYRPGQPGVMRASGETQVISVMTRPAPPIARAPRCTR